MRKIDFGQITEWAVLTEGLRHVAYLHDGTPEGMLTCVFEAYARHEEPEDIVCENEYQPRLGQSAIYIDTSEDKSERVRRGIEREAGASAFWVIMRAVATDDPERGVAIYRYIRYIMDEWSGANQSGSIRNNLTNPIVNRVESLANRTSNEMEKMRQFIRFSHLENDVWFARCNPSCSVVPFVMPHFAARFNMQPFIIYDEVHSLAGIYDGEKWSLVRGELAEVPRRARGDEYSEALWQSFYDAVTIDARFNPELRRSFMPMRLWRNLPEMLPRKSALVNANYRAM